MAFMVASAAQTNLQGVISEVQTVGFVIVCIALVVGAVAYMARSHNGVISHSAFMRVEAAVLAAIGIGTAPFIIGLVFNVHGL